MALSNLSLLAEAPGVDQRREHVRYDAHAQDHRENPVLDHVADRVRPGRSSSLCEAFLYVRQDDEDVAYVRDPELLPDVYVHLVVVGAVVRRGSPDALRPEARIRTESGPDVQRRPEIAAS